MSLKSVINAVLIAISIIVKLICCLNMKVMMWGNEEYGDTVHDLCTGRD